MPCKALCAGLLIYANDLPIEQANACDPLEHGVLRDSIEWIFQMNS